MLGSLLLTAVFVSHNVFPISLLLVSLITFPCIFFDTFFSF